MVVRTDEQPEFALAFQPQGAYPHNERLCKANQEMQRREGERGE